MSKMGSSGPAKNFELCPPGPQQLVCCDIVEHGMVKTPGFGPNAKEKMVPKVTIRWMSSHPMKDGRPYIVQRRYTQSSHKKATIRQDLEKWRGRQFTDQQAADFELENLLGVNAFASVVHQRKPRGVFAEVATLMPPMPGMPKLTIHPSYIRVKDRPKGIPTDSYGAPVAEGAQPDYDEPDGEYRDPFNAGAPEPAQPQTPEPHDDKTPF